MLRGLSEGRAPWGLPVFALGEFVRVVTHSRIFEPASTIEQALGFLEHLLGSPSVNLLTPGPAYWQTYRRVASDARATGNVALDAQIAAVCLEHGVETIITEDRDFDHFRGLEVRRLG